MILVADLSRANVGTIIEIHPHILKRQISTDDMIEYAQILHDISLRRPKKH